MRLLDPANIDGTRDVWEESMIRTLAQYRNVSGAEAERYLRIYREAETGTASGPIVRPGIDVAATRELLDKSGPRGFKYRIGQGQSPVVAYQNMANRVMAESRKIILSGGRDTVRESARENNRVIGWRRVSDGDPCAFCAMLVSRGPAYTEYAEALTSTNENSAGRGWVGKHGNPDPYHNNCGCTVEEVYSDWQPTELEQKFIDAYFDAAEAAQAADEPRNASAVLWRMRENGEFRDSPARRSKAS